MSNEETVNTNNCFAALTCVTKAADVNNLTTISKTPSPPLIFAHGVIIYKEMRKNE